MAQDSLGKLRSRANAVTHGLTARTIVPVLPHEDPGAFNDRIAAWTEDWQPQNDRETELVCHAAKLSWLIDRAGRAETAHLSHQVREASMRGGQIDPDQFEEIDLLGRKLFYDTQPRDIHRGIGSPPPEWVDQPAVFVRRFEQTREGCRWLLDRWLEFRNLIHREARGRRRISSASSASKASGVSRPSTTRRSTPCFRPGTDLGRIGQGLLEALSRAGTPARPGL